MGNIDKSVLTIALCRIIIIEKALLEVTIAFFNVYVFNTATIITSVKLRLIRQPGKLLIHCA